MSQRAGASKIILLAEDEFIIRLAVQAALEDAGYAVEAVGDGRAAISALDARAELFSALVTDVALAGQPDGWAVARHARELSPSLAVVYMTGHAEDDWAAHGVPHSVLATKPIASAQIVTAVSQLLNLT